MSKHVQVVLYRGTGCKPSMMNGVAKILRSHFKSILIKNVCWHTPDKKGILDDIANYVRPKNWNVQKPVKGTWDIIIGHSAGGFTNSRTKGKLKIAINPFIGMYPFQDYILHAKDDLLVQKDVPKKFKPKKMLILYDGSHNTVPTSALKAVLKKEFPNG